MNKKHRNKKTYNPLPFTKTPDGGIRIPSHYSRYCLFNPKFKVETVYQLLTMRIKEPLFLMRGTPEDFASNPNEVFRIINEPIKLSDPTKGETT